MKSPEERKRVKYADYCRSIGQPLHVAPAELAGLRSHLVSLYDQGMSYRGIAASAPGAHDMTSVAKVINRNVSTVHRDVYNDLMLARYERPTVRRSGRAVDPVGVRRRLQGLVAEGFGYPVLGSLLGVSDQAVFQLCMADRPARSSTVALVSSVYDKVAGADPLDFGATRQGASRALGVARRKGWPPARCWDPDTIDDPEASPDWTGACGTPFGRLAHRRDGIPICRPCVKAPAARFSGPRLASLRASRGFPQAALEGLAGLTRGHVHHWEGGRYNPRQGSLDRVLSVLDATYEDVYEVET